MRRSNKEYFVALRKKKKRDGICQAYSKKAIVGRVFCDKCRDKAAISQKKQRHSRIKRGMCTMCGKRKATKGRRTCSRCALLLSDAHKNRKTKRRIAGICVQCGKGKSILGTQQCSMCADKNRGRQVRARIERRRMVLRAYGNECMCCGEVEADFLEIDHVNNDGHKHRRNNPTMDINSWAIKHDFPSLLQILCANCNHSKEKHGKCIHAIREEREAHGTK